MRVLVVEDEVKLAGAIKRGLEQEAFAVDMVHDGDSGLAAANSDDYDLIILDWMLPGDMDGPAICKELRKENIHTPILMLTAKVAVDNRVNGLNAGADDYLTKPFAFSELIARVRALLRRPAEVKSTQLKVGELELDPDTRQAVRQGQCISLTHKEYAILEYLMMHPGQVLSKERIIQHTWDDEAEVMHNSVEVYIRYLREKVDRPFTNQLIRTVRGFGYKILA